MQNKNQFRFYDNLDSGKWTDFFNRVGKKHDMEIVHFLKIVVKFLQSKEGDLLKMNTYNRFS